MAFVPGFRHDVFVSYAHGDDRRWVEALQTGLQQAVHELVGAPIDVYLDKDDLAHHADYRKEIPEDLVASGVLLFLPSPTYLASQYCVDVECRKFEESLAERRTRFGHDDLKNSKFAFRCPILPIPENDHWALLEGLTDIPFHNAQGKFAMNSADYDRAFRELAGMLASLLRLMRNNTTPVFVHAGSPADEVNAAYQVLTTDLRDRGYRILPDKRVKIPEQLLSSSLSVFLIGSEFNEEADSLLMRAAEHNKTSVLWTSAEAVARPKPLQRAFLQKLRQRESRAWTELRGTDSKLKEEVLALLGPDPVFSSKGERKPSVYVVFDTRAESEALRAGQVELCYRKDFDFSYAEDRSQHCRRLLSSDLVLLFWGETDEDWCSREFQEIEHAANKNVMKTLCVFDPRDSKRSAIERIRSEPGLTTIRIAEIYGEQFDPRQMEPVFAPLRRHGAGQ